MDKLEEVKSTCESKGATDVLVCPQDLGDLDTVHTVVDRTIEKFGSEKGLLFFFSAWIQSRNLPINY